jgi:hypothetical protein
MLMLLVFSVLGWSVWQLKLDYFGATAKYRW